MSKLESCVFCYPSDEDLQDRIIHEDEDYRIFISKPRANGHRYHLLSIPTLDHYTELHQVPEITLGRMVGSLALFASWIHQGRGYVLGQKHQPLQTENGIKVNHVHVHSVLRTKEDEEQGILFPLPQTFDDFEKPETEIEKALQADDISLIRRELQILHDIKTSGKPWHEIRAKYIGK